MQHLDNARKYLDFGLEPQAARVFTRAYNALPDHLRRKVSSKVINEARSDYEEKTVRRQYGRFRRSLRDCASAGGRLNAGGRQPESMVVAG